MKKIMFLVCLIVVIFSLFFSYFLFFQKPKIVEKKVENFIKKSNDVKNTLGFQYDYDFKNNTIEQIISIVLQSYDLENTDLSYFYYDTNSKEKIISNEETIYYAASTVKVPLNMYYYDKINQGELSLDSMFYFTPESYELGGYIGEIYSYGDLIPLGELLEASIVASDNTATNILILNIGDYNFFRNTILSNYSNSYNENLLYDNLVDINYAFDTIKYLYDHQFMYEKLIQDMKDSKPDELLQATTKEYEIAHKYGSIDAFLHDYGIVYTQNPYLVGVFTNGIYDSENLIAELNNVFLQYTLYNFETK